MAKPSLNTGEIAERLRFATSDADLQDVLKNISEAQNTEKEFVGILKQLLNSVTAWKQEQQQTTSTCSLESNASTADDAAVKQEARRATIGSIIGNDTMSSDNSILQQEVLSAMISLKMENEALKTANNSLREEKQQIMKVVDAAVETNGSLRKSYEVLMQQFGTMKEENLALAQECERLRQQAEGRRDKEAMVVKQIIKKDEHVELSDDDLESDVRGNVTSRSCRAPWHCDSEVRSTFIRDTAAAHQVPTKQVYVRRIVGCNVDSDVSTSCKGGLGTQQSFPGTPVQIRSTSPRIVSSRLQDSDGIPALPAHQISTALRQTSPAPLRIRATSPLPGAAARSPSPPIIPRVALVRGPHSVCAPAAMQGSCRGSVSVNVPPACSAPRSHYMTQRQTLHGCCSPAAPS